MFLRMLTYQLQPRVFKGEKGTFTFPSVVTIEVKFAPPTAFGTKDDLSRTLVLERPASLIYNANTGRVLGKSKPPLEPLEVVIESPDSGFELKGDSLKYKVTCNNVSELEGTIVAFQHVLPTLLNIEFPDPPTVDYIKGWVGDTEFRWEHQECQAPLRVVTAETLEEQVVKGYDRLALLADTRNRRLAASLCYLHLASRLIVSGNSPWEFMAESILNMCKSMEILFVDSDDTRNDIRRELAKLGYTHEEIEGDFIPLLILRSHVDVAHPKVAIHSKRHLMTVYRYLSGSEDCLKKLIKRVIEAVEAGTYQILPTGDLTLNDEDKKGMDLLVKTMESRLIHHQKSPDT